MIVLLCPRRSGSTLFLSLLDSHPEIEVDYAPLAALAIEDRLDLAANVCIRVHYEELFFWYHDNRVLDMIRGAKIIHLDRADSTALALSYLRMHHGGALHKPDGQEISFTQVQVNEKAIEIGQLRVDALKLVEDVLPGAHNVDTSDFITTPFGLVTTWPGNKARALMQFLGVDDTVVLTNSRDYRATPADIVD